MFANRVLLVLSSCLLVSLTCSCGIVGPAGAVIAGVMAATGGGGGGGDAPPIYPMTASLGPDSPTGPSLQYDATDAVVLQLKLKNTGQEDVDVSSITLTARGSVDDVADITAVKLYFDQDEDGELDVADPQLGTDQTFAVENGTVTFTFAARTILQGDSELYLGVVDMAGTADHFETFQLGLAQGTDVSVQETVSGDPVTVGGAPVYGTLFRIQGVGQIQVAEGTNSPADGGVPEGATGAVVLQLEVTAGNAEAINLSSITLTASGTLNDATAFTSVELYRDANNNGVYNAGTDPQIDTDKTYAADDGTVVFDLTGKTLNAGQTENWLVVYDLTSPLTPNLTFQVILDQATHISGIGATTSNPALIVGTPVIGPVMYVQGVGTITDVSSVAGNPPNSSVPFVGEWPILHLSFTVGPNEPVDITQVVLNHTAAATASVATDVSEVRLYHDVNANGRYDCYADILLTTGTYSGDRVTLSSFTLTCTASGVTHVVAQYVMAADEAAASGRTHQVELDASTDVTAVGHLTSQSISAPAGNISGPTMTVLRDTWVSVDDTDVDRPGARYQHTAVSTGTDILVWGGRNSVPTHFQDGAIYHPLEDTWDAITTTGAPGQRRQHCAVWAGDKMFVWGGYDGTTVLGSGGLYDPALNSWTTASSVNAPSRRMDAVAVWTGSVVIVWGGYSLDMPNYLQTGGVYNPATDTWTDTNDTSANLPSGRRSMAAGWTGTGMIVWGGFNGTYLDDGAIYYLGTNSWWPVAAGGAPEERRYHTGVMCGTRFVLWGGYNVTNFYLNTGAYYQSGAWTDIDTGAPAERSEHTAVWDGKFMTVWGGRDASSTLQTGSRLDPGTRNWSLTTTTGAPSARRYHSADWAGAGMVVWGGSTTLGASVTSTGARYLP